jgi:hypothetical protein
MPGYHSLNGKRAATIVVRVTPAQKAAWERYVEEIGTDHGNVGVGNLIRRAVQKYIHDAPKKPGERESLYRA